jgi:hypothetical protein
VTVDDDGGLTQYTKKVWAYDPHCRCHMWIYVQYYVPPWVPEIEVTNYARVWRTADAGYPPSRVHLPRHGLHRAPGPDVSAGYAYCALDMGLANSVATPCEVDSGQSANTYVDSGTGFVSAVTEPF